LSAPNVKRALAGDQLQAPLQAALLVARADDHAHAVGGQHRAGERTSALTIRRAA
jgi:hypothetical protein